MEQEIRSYSVKSYLTSIKNKLSETPAVWVHGVITQIVEKPKIVYITIADFEEGDVKPIATMLRISMPSSFAVSAPAPPRVTT